MILLLFGADQRAIDRRLHQLKAEADGGSGMLTTNLAVVDGRDAKAFDVIAPAKSPPFLAPKRVVLVEHLLERFEAQGDQRRGRSVEPWKPLFDEMAKAGIPPTTTLVFTGPKLNGATNSFIDAAKKAGAEVEEHGELKGEGLLRYIRDEAHLRGIRMRQGAPRNHHPASDEWEKGASNDPVALIAALTNGDTLQVASELDKLALYTMGRDATTDDVYEVCAGERLVTQFNFVDAVMDGELLQALDNLAVLRANGADQQAMLSLLASAYRRLALLQDLLEQGMRPDEAGQKLRQGLQFPGLREAALRRMRAHGAAGIRRAYEVIVEADRHTKLGEVDADLALDTAVYRLALLARGTGGPVRQRAAARR